MLIAQISDLHVSTPGASHMPQFDGAVNLEHAIALLHSLSPRPDVVIATGDLVDQGKPEEYDVLCSLLDALQIPLYAVPGNHDDRAPFVAAFARDGYLPDAPGPLHYAIDELPVRLVGLDTWCEGRVDGEIDDAGLDWLDDTLSAEPRRSTLVFMHHPPFDTGIWWMDGGGCRNADRFRAVIERHPQVRRVVAGHVHHACHRGWGSTMVNTCPSLTYQIHPDLSGDGPAYINDDPPGFMLYRFDGAESVGHTVAVRDRRVIDLSARMASWDRLTPLLRARSPIPVSIFEGG